MKSFLSRFGPFVLRILSGFDRRRFAGESRLVNHARGNLIWRVQDPALAQGLLDEQTRSDWPALLRGLVEPMHPLWDHLHGRARAPYSWMTE
jgi:hypothetical protein